MPEMTAHHIADDPGRLEELVLGRLSDAERAEVEAHASGCERCARAIRNEQLLTAGAKRMGRDILKERLKAALEEPTLGIPWVRILSAAAVLFLLVGVGWLNHWFIPR